jgi:DmsE family decaheme c-type cytochrome
MAGRRTHTLCAGLLLLLMTCAAAAPQYLGSAACRTCHPNVLMDFYKNPHAKAMQAGGSGPEAAGCESCHGPGGEHVSGKGDKSKIVAFSLMKPEQALANCLRCHAESLGRMQIRRSQHTLAQVACNQCHSIHKTKTVKFLLAREQRDLCYGCHANVRAQFSMPFKHRVNEGVMRCTDCHNPHGSPSPTWTTGQRPRMVEAGLGNEEPCLKCHVDKRGPFAFEHTAVRVNGCASCHVAHGSANARLLRRPVVFTLCLECHTGAGDFGRQGDGIQPTPASHNMADPRFRNCTTCHVRIHGSNSDSSFLR